MKPSRKDSPGWCGSVDGVQAWESKGRWFEPDWFDYQSGHVPGLPAGPQWGAMQEATTHRCFSPSLSPSFPLFLKINK